MRNQYDIPPAYLVIAFLRDRLPVGMFMKPKGTNIPEGPTVGIALNYCIESQTKV